MSLFKCEECGKDPNRHKLNCPILEKEMNQAWDKANTRKPEYKVINNRLERIK